MSSEAIHVADPIPQDEAPVSSSNFFIVNLPDLARLSYCCDIGWVGINSDAVAEVFQSAVSHDDENTPELAVNPTYIIASVPAKRGVFAYGVVMGSLKSLKSKTATIKDRYKRDMPKYWDRVVRVSWLRVATAPWEGFAETLIPGSENNKSLFNWLTDAGSEFTTSTTSISSVPGTENPSATAWYKVPNRCGEELVAAIEAKGLTVLPHDLRAAHLNPEAYISSRQDGGQANGGSASHPQSQPPRSEQPIPMNFGSGGPQRGGYNQHGNNGSSYNNNNQQQQGGNAAYYNQNQGGGYGQQQQQPQQGGYGGNAYGNYNYNGQQHQAYDQQHQQQQQAQEVSSPNQQLQGGGGVASSAYFTPEQIEESAVAAFYAQSTEEQRNGMTDEEKGSTMQYYRDYYASYVPQ